MIGKKVDNCVVPSFFDNFVYSQQSRYFLQSTAHSLFKDIFFLSICLFKWNYIDVNDVSVNDIQCLTFFYVVRTQKKKKNRWTNKIYIDHQVNNIMMLRAAHWRHCAARTMCCFLFIFCIFFFSRNSKNHQQTRYIIGSNIFYNSSKQWFWQWRLF